MIRVGRGRSSSAQQRMRLARPRPARQHHVGSRPRHPADLATRSSPGRVDVSTRSNALYDRYATEPRVREVSPMAGHRAGQRAMRLLNGSDSRRLLAEPRESIRSERNGRRFRWSEAGWWAWEELNLRLHPYQQSRAQRCADGRFPRSLATGRSEVMRSIHPLVCVHHRGVERCGASVLHAWMVSLRE
jgi:hypothetical protein